MIEIEILLTFVYFLECTVVQCKDALSNYWNRHGHECSRIWKLSANFTLIQCIKIVSRFLGPRYIGDDFFLGPNLVSFNRTLVISWSRRRHIVSVSPRIQEVVLVSERFLGHQYIFFSLDISNISASFAGIFIKHSIKIRSKFLYMELELYDKLVYDMQIFILHPNAKCNGIIWVRDAHISPWLGISALWLRIRVCRCDKGSDMKTTIQLHIIMA
jgi:hypothetical protein